MRCSFCPVTHGFLRIHVASQLGLRTASVGHWACRSCPPFQILLDRLGMETLKEHWRSFHRPCAWVCQLCLKAFCSLENVWVTELGKHDFTQTLLFEAAQLVDAEFNDFPLPEASRVSSQASTHLFQACRAKIDDKNMTISKHLKTSPVDKKTKSPKESNNTKNRRTTKHHKQTKHKMTSFWSKQHQNKNTQTIKNNIVNKKQF